MSNNSSKSFRETALRTTRLCIDGVDADPQEVAANLSLNTENSMAPFEMDVSTMVLRHELEELGFQLELSELETFVNKDLREHPNEAIDGYLRIVQGVLRTSSQKSFWGVFMKPLPTKIKWLIVQVEQVHVGSDRITLKGKALQTN